MSTSLKIKQCRSFPMKYRSHDYQRAILRGTVMEIFRESSTAQAFYFYSKISFEFVATVIHREIHFCKREITNREDFCRLLGNGTITSARRLSSLHRVTYKFSRPTSTISNSGQRNATLCKLGGDF